MPPVDADERRRRDRDRQRQRRLIPKELQAERDRLSARRLRNTPDQRRLIIRRENARHNWPRGLCRCIDCEIVKELTRYNFYAKRGNTTGFSTICIDCEKIRRNKPEERERRRRAARLARAKQKEAQRMA